MDYLVNFPVTGLALALEGLDALRTEMGLPSDTLPGNALGDRRDDNGDVAVGQLYRNGSVVQIRVT